jgi:hypothetical protein
MRVLKSVLAGILLVGGMFGQVLAVPEKLPTYVGAGAAFNQIGTPRVNIWATAVYPVVSRVGLYSSTTTDIIPVLRLDAATNRQYYAFSTSIRQGLHKAIFTSGKFVMLVGGDAGIEMSQGTPPSGAVVSVAAAFTGTAVYQISSKWAVMVPVRGLWQNGAWNLVPEVGIVWKP